MCIFISESSFQVKKNGKFAHLLALVLTGPKVLFIPRRMGDVAASSKELHSAFPIHASISMRMHVLQWEMLLRDITMMSV